MQTTETVRCMFDVPSIKTLTVLTITMPATQPSLPSPDGQHIATLVGKHLEIRRVSTFAVVRLVDLKTSSKFAALRWSPVTKARRAERVLVAFEDVAKVIDIEDEQWSATIDNGTAGMGKIANAEFGADDTEVLVWSSFNARVTVWDLWSGKSIEIKDPKFANKGYSRRLFGRASILAMLSRPGSQDVLTLHAPTTYQPLRTIALPTTDAQGLKWSPDGKWLAVWDTPTMGYKVLIYTNDGKLYRIYSGDYFDDELKGLGVKTVEWSPLSDFLVVGGYERTVTLLSTLTFSPAVHLSHSPGLQLAHGVVWQEMASTSSSERTYQGTADFVQAPPASASTPSELLARTGVSMAGFSADGAYLATKDDSIPTAVWIWNLSKAHCAAVLLQHNAIKKFAWHPIDPDLLLVQCIQGEPLLYGWRPSTNEPLVLTMPDEARMSGKAEASWLATRLDRAPTLIYGDSVSFVLAFPEGPNETPSPLDSPQPLSQATEDDDSLFEILSGPESKQQDSKADDTFQFRRGIGAH